VREEVSARAELKPGETDMFNALETVAVRHGNRLVCGTAGHTQSNVRVAGHLCRERREPSAPVATRPGLVQAVDTQQKGTARERSGDVQHFEYVVPAHRRESEQLPNPLPRFVSGGELLPEQDDGVEAAAKSVVCDIADPMRLSNAGVTYQQNAPAAVRPAWPRVPPGLHFFESSD
jgi:hypothetical protein